jgi:hypothetical protein
VQVGRVGLDTKLLDVKIRGVGSASAVEGVTVGIVWADSLRAWSCRRFAPRNGAVGVRSGSETLAPRQAIGEIVFKENGIVNRITCFRFVANLTAWTSGTIKYSFAATKKQISDLKFQIPETKGIMD